MVFYLEKLQKYCQKNSIKNAIQNIQLFLYDLNQHSSIHGSNHIFDYKKHPLERFGWLLLVALGIYGSVVVSLQQLDRYQLNPMVVSLERDYNSWDIILPAITYCYNERFNETAAKFYIKKRWNIDPEHREYKYFYNFTQIIANIRSNHLEVFQPYENDVRFFNVNMLEIAKFVHPNNEPAQSSFDDVIASNVLQIITEMGICYTINAPVATALAINETKVKFSKLPSPVTCLMNKGACFMKIDLLGKAVSVAIHSPYEVPDNKMLFIGMVEPDEILTSYKLLETIADSTIRSLSPKRRKCFFPDESLESFPFYTVNLCQMKCKAEGSLRICGCKPFFYQQIDGVNCSPAALKCFIKWMGTNNSSCNCPKPCTDFFFSINSIKRMSWSANSGTPFFKSVFRWEILPPKIRLRRDIIFGFENLLVSFGGAASLFLGFSLWTFCKLIYFLLTSIFKAIKNIKLSNFI